MTRPPFAHRLVPLALGIGLLLAAGPAAADRETLYRRPFGAWFLESSRDRDDGSHMCALLNPSRDGRLAFGVLIDEQPRALLVSLADLGHPRPMGETGTATVKIDRRTWTVPYRAATATTIVANLASLRGSEDEFLNAFRLGRRMSVQVPGSAPYTLGLSQTNAAVSAMLDCVRETFGRGDGVRPSGKEGGAVPAPVPVPVPPVAPVPAPSEGQRKN